MNKANSEIRAEAKNANVKLWEIAAKLGINDVTFTKKLRFELPSEEKAKVLDILEQIKTQKQTATE